jgi:hypothetical protein
MGAEDSSDTPEGTLSGESEAPGDLRQLFTDPTGDPLQTDELIFGLSGFPSCAAEAQAISNGTGSAGAFYMGSASQSRPMMVPELTEDSNSSSMDGQFGQRSPEADSAPEEALPSVLPDVAAMIEDRTWRIGARFPSLTADPTAITACSALDRRSANVLTRMKCFSWADLAERTVGDLWEMQNSGRLTVSRIVSAAALRERELAPSGSYEFGIAQRPQSHVESPSNHALDVIERTVGEFLNEFIPWAIRERQASTLGELLNLAPSLGHVPQELSVRWEAIGKAQLGVLANSPATDLPSDLASRFVNDIGPNSDLFVARKINCGETPTLEALAKPRGVTRERIRQIVEKCVVQANRQKENETYKQLLWRAEDLAHALGSACMCESEEAQSALRRATLGLTDPDRCTASELMLWLAGPFNTNEGWYVIEGKKWPDFRSEFEEQVGDVMFVKTDQARGILEGLGMRVGDEESVRSILADWRDIGDGWFARWSGGLGDKAEIVLSLTLRAGTPEEINDAIDEGHATSSLRNVLSGDVRFVRLDRANHFGLRNWGWEEYSGIAQEIRERIDRSGGSADLEDVIAELVEEFGVSESSVRSYSGAPMFVIESGKIRMRSEVDGFTVRGRIASVRGLYVNRMGDVIVHVVVDRDLLRGSGRPLHEAASVPLGLSPGDRFQLSDGRTGGHLTVSWPRTSANGPSLGSLKSALLGGEFNEGDRIRIKLSRSKGRFEIEPVVEGSLRGLTGLDTRPGLEVQDIAGAMQCDVDEVRACLQSRGDDEVLHMLPAVELREDLSAALAEFGDLLG